MFKWTWTKWTWIHCFPLWVQMQKADTESSVICAKKQPTSLLIFSCINNKLHFQCFDLDSINFILCMVRKGQLFAYLPGEKESGRCLEKVESHGKVFCHPQTNKLSSEMSFLSFHGIQHSPPDRKWVNQIGTMSFVSELQVSCPEEVTWDRKAAHNALDQRDVTSKRLWERRSVNPSA